MKKIILSLVGITAFAALVIFAANGRAKAKTITLNDLRELSEEQALSFLEGSWTFKKTSRNASVSMVGHLDIADGKVKFEIKKEWENGEIETLGMGTQYLDCSGNTLHYLAEETNENQITIIGYTEECEPISRYILKFNNNELSLSTASLLLGEVTLEREGSEFLRKSLDHNYIRVLRN